MIYKTVGKPIRKMYDIRLKQHYPRGFHVIVIEKVVMAAGSLLDGIITPECEIGKCDSIEDAMLLVDRLTQEMEYVRAVKGFSRTAILKEPFVPR